MATKVVSKEADYDPLCPHCEKKINEIHWRRVKSWTTYEYLFICPTCQKVIGVGSSRT